MIGDGEEIVCDGSLRQQVQAPLPELTVQDDDYIEVQTGTIWKFTTERKICNILQGEPRRNLYLKSAGLVATFEQEWPRLALPAVKDFVRGFVTESSKVQFRGRTLDWNVSTLRAAFCLPSDDFAAWKTKWVGPIFDQMFTVARIASNPYSVEKLRPEFSNLQRPIRLIHELLLGKSRPTCLNGKQMWVYWSYWWHYISQEYWEGIECPQLKPDWARLVHEDLTSEIVALRNHLNKKSPPKKRYASNYGSAITKYLLHYGYSMKELLQEENNKDENEGGIEPVLQNQQRDAEEEDKNAVTPWRHDLEQELTYVWQQRDEEEEDKNATTPWRHDLEQELTYVWRKYDEMVEAQYEDKRNIRALSAEVAFLKRAQEEDKREKIALSAEVAFLKRTQDEDKREKIALSAEVAFMKRAQDEDKRKIKALSAEVAFRKRKSRTNIGEDAIHALFTIETSVDDTHLEAVGMAALAVILGVEKEDTALVGSKFEEMDVDIIKRTYSALVCVFLEAAKNDLFQAEILSFLRSECGFSEARGEIISRIFAGRKEELRGLLSQTGNHSYLPQLEGVDWKLEYCAPAPDNGAVRELLYRVGLKLINREEGKEDTIEFIASVEELQELVSGLKDACKSAERVLNRR